MKQLSGVGMSRLRRHGLRFVLAISLLLIGFGLPLALAGLFLSWKEQGEDA